MSAVVTLPGGRIATLVPADDAGEFTLRVADGIVEQMEGHGLLTWRQAEALNTLGRLYRAGGGRLAYYRGGGGGERPEEAAEAARTELAGLLALVREPTRGHLLAMVATGEWPVTARVSWVQDAATAVADRLKLAGEEARQEKPARRV